MKDLIIWILIFKVCFAEEVVSDTNFNGLDGVYKFTDVNYWSGQCTNGTRQSPIELNKKSAIKLEFVELHFSGYEANQEKVTITNNGHSIMLSKFPHEMELSGLPWNANSTWRVQGISIQYQSEHMLNGHHHPLEVHIMHRNTRYEKNKDAAQQPDGFALIAILYKIHKAPKPPLQNLPLDLSMVRSAADINIPKVLQHSLVVKNLLPDPMGYYHYEGSLLSPPCSEVVTWIVIDSPYYVTVKQLAEFKKVEFLEGPAGKPRPIQELHSRTVELYATGHKWTKRTGSAIISLPMGGALLCFLAAVIFVCM